MPSPSSMGPFRTRQHPTTRHGHDRPASRFGLVADASGSDEPTDGRRAAPLSNGSPEVVPIRQAAGWTPPGWLIVVSETAFIATLSLLAALAHRRPVRGDDLLAAAASTFVAITGYFLVRRFLRRRLASERNITIDQLQLQLQFAVQRIEAEPARAPQLLSTMLREWIHLAVTTTSPTFVPLLRSRSSPEAASTPLTAEAEAAIGRIERFVALEAATERGRLEERVRLAHDLHDDIGSRLLTLIYKAQAPELERDLRKTLDDLKTLTRGLAAQHHRLADAAAEWRLDLMQRTALAELVLDWSCRLDDDPALTVVQWSALTRILRELVSNALAHADARLLRVHLVLDAGRLELIVADDGHGCDPQRWAHGLGLSSVRKRVNQLGGEVAWALQAPRGILCRVHVMRLTVPP